METRPPKPARKDTPMSLPGLPAKIKVSEKHSLNVSFSVEEVPETSVEERPPEIVETDTVKPRKSSLLTVPKEESERKAMRSS